MIDKEVNVLSKTPKMHRHKLFLSWHFIACAELKKKDDHRIEQFIKSLSEFNDCKEKETTLIYNKNTQNVYIHITQNTHDLSAKDVSKSFIKAVLSLYCKNFSFPALNIFSGKIDYGLIYDDQHIFSLIMQIFCKVRLHYNEPINYEYQKETFIKIRQENQTIVDVHGFENYDKYDESNFIIIENCVTTEEDALYMYKIMSKIHEYNVFDVEDLNIIFALETKNMTNKHLNKIINCTSILANLSKTLNCNTTFLAKIHISKDNSDTQQNIKKMQIGKCYIFDNKKNRFTLKNNILYKKEQNSFASIFKLYNYIEILNTNNNKKFYLSKQNSKEHIREYSYKIIISTFKKKYVFWFQIVRMEISTTKQDQQDKVFIKNLITIYYVYKNAIRIYGRYSYIEQFILLAGNELLLCTDQIIVLDGQNFFKKFKNDIMTLMNYTFMDHSDFLPTSVYFLQFVNFLNWNNGHTIFFSRDKSANDIKHIDILLSLKYLKCAYQKNIKFEFFEAKLRHKQYHMNLYYNLNIFNILNVIKVIKYKDLNDTLLGEIEFLIIAITVKDQNAIKSDFYLILPFKACNLASKIIKMNQLLQALELNDKKTDIDKVLHDVAISKVDYLFKNQIFKLPLEYLNEIEENNDFNYIFKDSRLNLTLIFIDIKFKVLNIKIDKIFYKRYKLFTEDKIPERDLYEYIHYTSLHSLLKENDYIKFLKLKFLKILNHFYMRYLDHNEEYGSIKLYDFHQADVIDIHNERARMLNAFSKILQ